MGNEITINLTINSHQDIVNALEAIIAQEEEGKKIPLRTVAEYIKANLAYFADPTKQNEKILKRCRARIRYIEIFEEENQKITGIKMVVAVPAK